MPIVPKSCTRLLGLIMATALSVGVQAAPENQRVRIGVLNDQSGMYSASSGAGSVVAAQLAAEDAAAAFPGMHVEIVSADHQNKPDIGAEIARRWYDQGGVDAIADVPSVLSRWRSRR